ncbi:MAG: geranylgeranylglyceryl/heptaprenylglyceryl phosphate synthase [Salinirussus sp.]
MATLADIVRAIDSIGAALSIGSRTVLSLDTNTVPADWGHITKIDPELEKQLPFAYPLYLQHTSAVSVGGSSGVTGDLTEETFELLNAARIPSFHEPSAARHVTDRTRKQAEFMAVPEVLNGDSEALVGTLGEGIEHVRDDLAPSILGEKLPIPLGDGLGDRFSAFAAAWLMEESVFEAYIIQNPDSAAAREANVTESDLLSPTEARQRAMAAETHLDSEVIYLEYSGTFGGDEAVSLLEAIDDAVNWSRIWYGGGLDDRDNTERVLAAGADAVVVGNVFHEIADEEADLADRALEALGTDPTREAVEDWVTETVDAADTAAARYLATITDIQDPATRGARYLAAGVHAVLQLHGIAAGLDAPDAAALREAVAESAPAATAFADALGTDATDLAADLGLALLADRFDVSLDAGAAGENRTGNEDEDDTVFAARQIGVGI